MNGKLQLLVFADDVNSQEKIYKLLGRIQKIEILIKVGKDIGLEANSEKTKYMITSRQQNIVQNQKIQSLKMYCLKMWKSSNIRE